MELRKKSHGKKDGDKRSRSIEICSAERFKTSGANATSCTQFFQSARFGICCVLTYKKISNYNRHEENAHRVAEGITGMVRKALLLQADVGKKDQIDRMFDSFSKSSKLLIF